jgi:hypothetical protein
MVCGTEEEWMELGPLSPSRAGVFRIIVTARTTSAAPFVDIVRSIII